MQYKISNTKVKLSDSELNMIDTRIALNLSRFATAIENLTVSIEEIENRNLGRLFTCAISVELIGASIINLEATGDDLDAAFLQLINKMKRSIERHLKHRQLNRINTDSTTRIDH